MTSLKRGPVGSSFPKMTYEEKVEATKELIIEALGEKERMTKRDFEKRFPGISSKIINHALLLLEVKDKKIQSAIERYEEKRSKTLGVRQIFSLR